MNRPFLAFTLLTFAAVAGAQSGNPVYQSFEGASIFTTQGYQELQLSENRWYVAYQGSEDTAPAWVESAWATRSAQLCGAGGAKAFVELRYAFEAVTQQDVAEQDAGSDGARFIQTGTPVYVPIFTPSGPRAIPPVLGPSKLAAIRCLSDADILKNPSRSVSVKETLDRAPQAGVTIAR